MLIISPKYVYEEFLGIRWDDFVLQVMCDLAKPDAGKEAVRKWLSEEKIPKKGIFLKIIEKLESRLGDLRHKVCFPINGTELISQLKNPDWPLFAMMGKNAPEDNLLREAYLLLLRFDYQNFEVNKRSIPLVFPKGLTKYHRISSFLSSEMLDLLEENTSEVKTDQERRFIPDVLEGFGLLYYLAVAEVEFLRGDEKNKESILLKFFPSSSEGRIEWPIKKYFNNIVDQVKERESLPSREKVFDRLGEILKLESPEKIIRRIDRYAEGTVKPDWFKFRDTIKHFVKAFFPEYGKCTREVLDSTETIFAGILIVDKLLRIFSGSQYRQFGFYYLTDLRKFYSQAFEFHSQRRLTS